MAPRDLLDVLRERGVRSAMRGCADGTCGSCRVIVDGALLAACQVAPGDVRDGAVIESYDDLEEDPAAARAVDAFSGERPSRCRLCTGALGVTAVSLARAGKSGDPDAVEDALRTATCVCTGRGSLRRALLT